MSGFEGSYMGEDDRISDRAVMECKICWTVYDPAKGDDTRQIPPRTPFRALPDDWKCPVCDAPKEQFMVQSDPGAVEMFESRRIEEQAGLLAADFREVWNSTMREMPLVNKALRVEAVGFRPWEGRGLGVLISPWFMNLILLPGAEEDWAGLHPGDKELIDFPSGSYEFIHNRREQAGGYKACSLFSPMDDFQTQAQAVDVAKAVMQELFKEENRAETDRAEEIRVAQEARSAAERSAVQQAEAEKAAAGKAQAACPSRRQVISGGLAETGEDETGTEPDAPKDAAE